MIDFFSRLDKFMEFKGLNDNRITIDTGISNGLIGKARKRGSLSQENISKILYTYPELDANWLLTGKGEMLNTNDRKRKPPEKEKDDHYLIALQRKHIEKLEEEIETLKKELQSDAGYRNVAKPKR